MDVNAIIKKHIYEALYYTADVIARYRRLVELEPEINGMTTEEFDRILNKACEDAHDKFASMDLFGLLMDGMKDIIKFEENANGKKID